MPHADRTWPSYSTRVGARYSLPERWKIRPQTSSVLPSTLETNCPISSDGAPFGAGRVSCGAETCCPTWIAVPGSKPRKYAMTATTIPPMPSPPPTMPMPRRSSTLPLARWFPSSMRAKLASFVPLDLLAHPRRRSHGAAEAVEVHADDVARLALQAVARQRDQLVVGIGMRDQARNAGAERTHRA